MEIFRCHGCGQVQEAEETWVLPHLGQRCTNCAIEFLVYYSYWARPFLGLVLKKVKDRVQWKEAEKECQPL